MRALEVLAGPRARARLRECGLRAADVRVIPAAAGGPKGLVFNPLDRFIFGRWLTTTTQVVHLLGASIGAWRMACAALQRPEQALAQMAEDYITQSYPHRPGKSPAPADVSAVFGATLGARLDARAPEILSHPRLRLHVFTARGRHLLRRPGALRTPLGYMGAFAANVISRRAMGLWLERALFSDPRDELPFGLQDYRTRRIALGPGNLSRAILASCSIPFWLDAVQDIEGAPPGAYWDGGITDYHLKLDYAAMAEGLVLYPHFQTVLVPGWLDKMLRHRHRAGAMLDNLVLLVPKADWVRSLPNGKLPDRSDFLRYVDAVPARMHAWRKALAESQRLADEFAALVEQPSIEARPLG